jgi:hypothetical protein
MTTADKIGPRAKHPRALQDDLRQAAPMPVPPPVHRAAPPPEERRGTAWVQTPTPRATLELRVTLWQWSTPVSGVCAVASYSARDRYGSP